MREGEIAGGAKEIPQSGVRVQEVWLICKNLYGSQSGMFRQKEAKIEL